MVHQFLDSTVAVTLQYMQIFVKITVWVGMRDTVEIVKAKIQDKEESHHTSNASSLQARSWKMATAVTHFLNTTYEGSQLNSLHAEIIYTFQFVNAEIA